ncbi:MAG TPA: ATP-binding cassette domain-containing protein [Acidobacteria bacterium]|jgi:molybdate transport system ATP-binding protein|nr:ATP-binding cassette domain-containing protein [Acidobacteriota bacterium]
MSFSLTLEFTLQQGEFSVEIHERIEADAIALYGPSGAGKTTVLEAVAGLRQPDRGRIAVGDRTLFGSESGIDVPAHHRCMGYVPQEVALFPHMNVRQNVTYGAHGAPTEDLARVLAVLDLEPLVERRVEQLSGGEQKRTAIARALMAGSRMLLLDEPLSALDVALQRRVVQYLVRVHDEFKIPMLYVSHRADEVSMLTNWVVQLDNGRVVASGPSEDILARV